jgi:hypothetical protein
MEASEKDARGLYKLTPKEPLKPGEYGFVLTYGMAAGASGRVYASASLRRQAGIATFFKSSRSSSTRPAPRAAQLNGSSATRTRS